MQAMVTRVRLLEGVTGWRSRRRLRSCARVGAGTLVDGEPTIFGGERITIGDRFQFGSSPSPSHMGTWPGGTIEIGDDVGIGYGAGIAAHTLVRIGSGTRIGPFAFILDSDFHGVSDRSGPAKSEAIVIGRGVRIGSRVTVLRGSEIGDGAIVAAGSVVFGKILAGARVGGVTVGSRSGKSS
jgi:acetyltransferase-like isoleucine patch superfamily enzyme